MSHSLVFIRRGNTYFRVILSILVGLTFQIAQAQPIRQFIACDSTAHPLNADTTIIAGRYKLYCKTDSGINFLHDFSTDNADFYIRDFDIVHSNLWYSLVGSRFISDLTTLYKSADKGVTWAVDTSYFSAIDSSILQTNIGFNPLNPLYINSINQVQKIGNDTILLFLGYYSSGIVYSIDGGGDWKHWFANTPAHYFGFLECNNKYFLHQMPGDGFLGRMFPFEKQYLFRNDSIVNFDHLPSGSGHHPPFHITDNPNVLYFGNITYCDTYDMLTNHVDSICNNSTSTKHQFEGQIGLKVYPNPSKNGIFRLELNHELTSPIEIVIYNYLGQIEFRHVYDGKESWTSYTVESNLITGIYFLWVNDRDNSYSKKIIIY